MYGHDEVLNCTESCTQEVFKHYIHLGVFLMQASVITGKRVTRTASASRVKLSEDAVLKAIEPLAKLQQDTNSLVQTLQRQITVLQQQQDQQLAQGVHEQYRHWFLLAVIILAQVLLQWIFK